MAPYDDDEVRWKAVKERDRDAAHEFYYGVRTTGVYCVPGCASRLPRRENAVFFDTAEAAEAAGFRACKRCRPDDPAHAHIPLKRIMAACRTLERAVERGERPPGVAELARDTDMSSSRFGRLFSKLVGIGPKEYVQALRDAGVREALASGTPVTRALFDAGYSSASRFYERAEGVLGMRPARYRKGGKGLSIRYVVTESQLGLVLAAFTGKGVCAIELGDTPEELAASLRARFPGAVVKECEPQLDEQVREIVSLIRTPGKGLSLPLDIRGTAFQQRVWRALRDIPAGETRTYSQVAESLGEPGSVRAVASACARNPLAVAVPCHRVVRKDGSLAGYRWGLERKRALLEAERHGRPGEEGDEPDQS
ncbi:bifunctional DNA-binding transcriptional regulator/O6-methylguanine-DNA methyltransferase Ada [Pseudodesulfovibrio cashew]|uniref:methylated-DNA--[protein]-cysteine S-methyltransferase n=1 Tax=Pseudodesulfovibrio cashew TaxID=2678688 RepID=A0A6I6J9G5_9BACT|nr:bifunctional DNA-binding transcriptional regulator/O6-methylguanine-DNA methyltransferase Ada [Pseudodesulfovibrio cashew]QGY39456.1 bifunctional DNA-binding transcriptional regulator/O6-methylguanine-DNA methyltransferase Ada [Pseudodesulfovibrio cashew]